MSPLQATKSLGTAAQIVGVFLLSTHVGQPSAAFGVMLVGSLLWMAASFTRDWNLFLLNVAFTVSNIIGIARWLP